MATVDIKTAALILDRAFLEAKRGEDNLSQAIIRILHGRHKTYRYILVNALLAKATNESIDALSLQKGDGRKGKYDARTLCHKVVVPFERLKLPGSIGDSNEPFLNKPARFVSLAITNAVRSGKDKETLKDVIYVLSQINTSSEAYKYLRSAMVTLKENHDEYMKKFSVADAVVEISEFSQLVLDYIYKITDYTLGGETCSLIVAELERLHLGTDYTVVPHKINESGASSKEVGDVDVFDAEGTLVSSIEVKDKDFSVQDVVHAISKFRAANLNNSLFVYGKNVEFDEKSVCAELRKIGREGHFCCLISILNYAKMRVSELKEVTVGNFIEGLLKFSKVINAKDDTISVIKEISRKLYD